MRRGGRDDARLDGAAVTRWVAGADGALDSARAVIDRLNVFPVADSDTGTNLLLTLRAGRQALAASAGGHRRDASTGEQNCGPGTSAVAAVRAVARGALIGARGNSGVILSQYLAGFADGLVGCSGGSPDDHRLAHALDTAQQAAVRAVGRPAEGTILTVARVAGEAAQRALRQGGDPLEVAEAAVAAARAELDRTRTVLPVLRRAGVVDAGGLGLVLVLEALRAALGGSTGPDPDVVHDLLDGAAAPRPSGGRARPAAADVAHTGGSAGCGADDVQPTDDGEFEVMYVLELPPTHATLVAGLRERLAAIGESLAVVGRDGLWQVHVHTDHPVDAIAYGAQVTRAAGAGARQRQVCVRHLLAQSGVHAGRAPVLGVVACTRAPGLVPDLARAGAVVVAVPDGAAPTPEELDRAVADTGARHVVVLPGQRMPAAAVTPAVTGARTGPAPVVRVLDAWSEVHVVAGMAALAVADSDSADVAEAALTRSVAAVRAAEVDGTPGDGVVEELLAGGGEVLTVVRGAGVGEEVIATLRERAAARGAETVVLDGGQEHADLVLGVE